MMIDLTAGEIEVLNCYWPGTEWTSQTPFRSFDDGLILKKKEQLQRESSLDIGTKKFSPRLAYHAQMLSRVLAKLEEHSAA